MEVLQDDTISMMNLAYRKPVQFTPISTYKDEDLLVNVTFDLLKTGYKEVYHVHECDHWHALLSHYFRFTYHSFPLKAYPHL